MIAEQDYRKMNGASQGTAIVAPKRIIKKSFTGHKGFS